MDAPGDPPPNANPSLLSRLAEVAILFSRLGFTAFGGPAAHVAMMEDEVVVRRRWLDRKQFLDAFAAINFIPGPNSTELAIHLGYVRAGFLGLLMAGVCFIVPAVLIILPIAWAYVKFGSVPQVQSMMVGINAAVVAIVVAACVRFGQSAIKDAFTRWVAIGALVAAAGLTVAHARQPDLTVLAFAAFAGLIRHRQKSAAPLTAGFFPLLASPLSPAAVAPAGGGLFQLAGVFLKIGATLFGSGYVLVSYLQSSVVDTHGWLTHDQLLTAVSVGQFTPGPLLTTATFVGYLRGWEIFHTFTGAISGAVVATAAIFAPAFVLIALLGPFFPRLRKSALARAILDAVNAAVVALIALAAIRLAGSAMGTRDRCILAVPVCMISLMAVLRYNLNATWTVLFGAAAGLLRQYIAGV